MIAAQSFRSRKTPKRTHWRVSLPCFLMALVVAGPSLPTEAPAPEYWPTKEWKFSTPEAQGLDGAMLQKLVDLIREGEKFPDLHSLLVVRNGYLVIEEFFFLKNPQTLRFEIFNRAGKLVRPNGATVLRLSRNERHRTLFNRIACALKAA
jgi:hypothetical protein